MKSQISIYSDCGKWLIHEQWICCFSLERSGVGWDCQPSIWCCWKGEDEFLTWLVIWHGFFFHLTFVQNELPLPTRVSPFTISSTFAWVRYMCKFIRYYHLQVKTDSNRLLKFIACDCLKELEMAYPVSKCVWKSWCYSSLCTCMWTINKPHQSPTMQDALPSLIREMRSAISCTECTSLIQNAPQKHRPFVQLSFVWRL